MWPGFKDDEYVIQMSSSCDPVRLYCHGMNTATPREYITLPAGPDKNFASFHRGRLLNFETCSGSINPEPKLTANYWGTTRYRKKTLPFFAPYICHDRFIFLDSLVVCSLCLLVCLFTYMHTYILLFKAFKSKDKYYTNNALKRQFKLIL